MLRNNSEGGGVPRPFNEGSDKAIAIVRAHEIRLRTAIARPIFGSATRSSARHVFDGHLPGAGLAPRPVFVLCEARILRIFLGTQELQQQTTAFRYVIYARG